MLDSGQVADGKRPANVQVFVDELLYAAQPSGFGILQQQLFDPITVTPLTLRKARVSFSVPYRLQGHRIMAEVQDANYNSAYYAVYPKGGF